MESIFPFIQPQQYVDSPGELPLCVDVEWDFKNDRPAFKNGKPVFVSKLPAVLSWAIRALKTSRFVEDVYSWNYGSEIARLKGEEWDADTKQAESERYVRECLTQSPYITGISEISADFNGGKLSIRANIETIYGNAKLEVIV